MNHVSPQQIIDKKIILAGTYTEVTPSGIDCTISETVIIPPKGFVNVSLEELIKLPEGMIATTHSKGSLSSMGVFTTTGVWTSFESKSHGVMDCSMYNMSDVPITIESGRSVIHFIFWN